MRSLLYPLALSLSLISVPALALEHHKLSGGVGFNINTVDSEESTGENIDEEVSASLAIGLKEELKINDEWYIRTGAFLQEKSAKYSIDIGNFDGTVEANTIYLTIPLNAQYQIKDNIAVFGGYNADIRINDYCEADGDVDGCTLEDDTESFVHVATLGGSIALTDVINLDLSYEYGISDVMEDDGYKINTLKLMAFFKFN